MEWRPYNGAVFSLSPIKIMVIVAVALLLLGPDKLPDVAHKLGSSWRALKRIQERVEAEVREVIPDLPSPGDIARIARSPVNLLNQLADRVDAKEEEKLQTSGSRTVAASLAPSESGAAGDRSAESSADVALDIGFESESESESLISPVRVTPASPPLIDAVLPPDPSLN